MKAKDLVSAIARVVRKFDIVMLGESKMNIRVLPGQSSLVKAEVDKIFGEGKPITITEDFNVGNPTGKVYVKKD